MLVFRLADGAAYMFPTFNEMIRDLDWMLTNRQQEYVTDLKTGLAGVAKSGGSAEIARLKYLKMLIALRLGALEKFMTYDVRSNEGARTDREDIAVVGSTATGSTLASRQSELKVVADYVTSPPVRNNPGRDYIQDTAWGKQAFDVYNVAYASADRDDNRALSESDRVDFYSREMNVANAWIDARLKFMSDNFSVS